MKQERVTVLGVETSCDETAAAIVRLGPDGAHVLSDIVLSQIDAHAPYRGVVPEIAARAHVEGLDGVIEAAMREAEIGFAELDGVAATAGPGLIGGVMVGLVTAKAIAIAHGKPLLAINHLEGHALSPRLAARVDFPYLLLLVSGGHCQFIAVLGLGDYRRLGSTIDDALGEAYDKVAKALDLGFPGGPAVEALAAEGDPTRFNLPRPLLGREGCDFSFAGLKTAVAREAARRDPPPCGEGRRAQRAGVGGAENETRETEAAFANEASHSQRPSPPTSLPSACAPGLLRGNRATGAIADRSEAPQGGGGYVLDRQTKADLCASFQAAILDVITDRTHHAMRMFDPMWGAKGRLVVAGGVAANRAIRSLLETLAAERRYDFFAPPQRWCTDNAAMIALAGAERLMAGFSDPMDAPARARWPLDEAAAASRPTHKAGRKGAKA